MVLRFWPAWMVCLVLLCAGCGGDDEDTPPPPECPGSYGVTLLPLPTFSSSSSAESLNAGGEVVGEINGDAARWSGGGFSAIVNTFGGFNSLAVGINDAGHIVGGAETSSANVFHPFLFANGTLTDLGTLGGSSGFAQAINNAGDIVGSAQTSGNATTHAFVVRGGTMQDLGTLGGSTSSALGINQAGDIVGSAHIAGDLQVHAFLYQSGVMRDLGTLGGSESRAFAVNDAGQVVGSSFTVGSSDDHAFLYQNGSMVDLNPGGPATAWSLNNRGHVVGRLASQTSPTGWHAFRYCGGTATDLNGLLPAGANVELVDASDINDNGQIVGTAVPAGSTTLRAYLLTPL